MATGGRLPWQPAPVIRLGDSGSELGTWKVWLDKWDATATLGRGFPDQLGICFLNFSRIQVFFTYSEMVIMICCVGISGLARADLVVVVRGWGSGRKSVFLKRC